MASPRIEPFTADDGYRFFVRIWDSPRPVARVFFLHGIISHGGWYHRSCAQLAEAGLEVHFLERRGSGLNPAARGEIDSFHTWIRDIADYLQAASSDDLPRVLAGISWGGKLAAAVAKSRGELLGGLALICPGIHAKRGANRFERGLLRLVDLTPARRRRVTVPLQDPKLFTDAPAWQRMIAADPLALRRVTVRFARESLAMDAYLRDAAAAINVPTLLMLAGGDRIIDNAQMRRFFDRLRCRGKRLIEYPDAGHTFEFGSEIEKYAYDFAAWCICTDNSK